MNERERYVKQLLFENVDKVPFYPGGPRESTLKRWHREGLPEDVNWYDYVCEKLGIKIEKTGKNTEFFISFEMIPEFEENIIERKEGHLIVQTHRGEIVEIDEKYDFSYLRRAKDFVTRKYHKFPVENRNDWEKIKKRYDPESPERFPENIEKVSENLKKRDYPLVIGIPGPFWKMRDWCGLENLCIFMATEPDFVCEMSFSWKDFVINVLKKVTGKIQFDSVIISEDMAYKEKSMISPSMVKKFLSPVWENWVSILKESGCKVIILDSDGYIGQLIPLWIESGINCTIPVEVAAGNDIVEYRKKFGKNISFIGGINTKILHKQNFVVKGFNPFITP